MFNDRKIEEKRGVTLSDNGIPESKPYSAANGPMPGAVNKTSTTVSSSSVMTKSTSWDDDWIPSRQSTTAQSSTAKPSAQSTLASPRSLQSLVASVTKSSQQLPTSVPAVDVEWPPRSSTSDLNTQLGNSENLTGDRASSSSSLDEIDPFADWPPRPSGSTSAHGSSSNGTMASKLASTYGTGITNDLNLQSSNNTMSWAFSSQNSTEPMRQNQGNSTLNFSSLGSGLNAQSSLGYVKQTQGVSSRDTSTERATDLGSIFSVNRGEQTALRLAPPPATAIGRGRGRGRGNQGQIGATSTSRPIKMKSQSEQPPLLDLL